jgi:probable rRNA maturation factor
MAILFFEEDLRFPLKDKNKHKKWLRNIAAIQDKEIGELNYIFCSDEYLYQMNVNYLGHNSYTDVITFDHSEDQNNIEGDIFISIERVRENAGIEKTSIEVELLRVMSHGLLHLMGYKDKKEEEKKLMREMENRSIAIYPS